MDQPASPATAARPFSVTHRSVLAIAVPMTLAYLTTPLIGVVDTAVVGQFGDAALLGGLATGALVFDVVFRSFNFVRSGTTGLVAQAFGRGDAAEEQAVFWRAFAIALVAGSILALFAPLFALAGQWFMGAEPRVDAALDTYIRIRLLAVRALAVNYLPWAVFTAVSGVLAFQMDGVFIGATWSRDMRNMMLLSFLVFVAALATLTPAFGNSSLWAALHAFLIVRGFSLLAILRLKLRTAF